MAKVTPAEFAEKYVRRMTGAVEDIRHGVENVTEAPTLKAAAKQDKMLSHLTESVRSGKWADGLKRVSLDDWKTATLEKGIGRIPQGVAAAQTKMEEFGAELLPFVDRAREEISRLPDVTLEDNVNRMVSFIRKMSQFKRRR